MKILKSIAMVTLAAVLFVNCKKNTEESEKIIPQNQTEAPKLKQDIAPENLQAATFKIEGMTCAVGCAKTIQEELSDSDGVQSAEVDFDKKLATVTFDKTVQNQSSLTQIVQATGNGTTYKVSDFN